MIHANDLTTLRSSRLTEREALVAAAVLPHLSDDECLLRIRARSRYEYPDDTRKFKAHAPTISNTRLRRVEYNTDTPTKRGDTVELTPVPHGRRAYDVSGHDFVAFQIGDDPDFDDTDQAFLADFGVTPTPCDAVHDDVSRADDADFDRRPLTPV